MRNGSNIGEYNYAIIHNHNYMWAKNIEVAADMIDIAITPQKDLPLLIGQMKSKKCQVMLEKALKGDL